MINELLSRCVFFYVIVIKQIVKHIVKIGYQYAW
jgi:hypothetical protein